MTKFQPVTKAELLGIKREGGVSSSPKGSAPPTTEEWEKDFDKIFGKVYHRCKATKWRRISVTGEIKDFISRVRTQASKEERGYTGDRKFCPQCKIEI